MRSFMAVALIQCALAPVAWTAEKNAAVERVRGDLFYLAGEACEGRGLDTKGILKAGERIAETFQQAGLQPANKGTYYQEFDLPGEVKRGQPNSVVLNSKDKNQTLKLDTDFAVLGESATGKAKGEVVFAGYGISSKPLDYDDYADRDVKGKFVIILRRTPRADDAKRPFDKQHGVSPHAAITAKIENATNRGAIGIAFVNDRSFESDGDPLLDFRQLRSGGAKIPVIHLKRALLDQLLESQKSQLKTIEETIDKELKPQSITLEGWSIDVETNIERGRTLARNVIGVCEGKGALAEETIVVGAHYDHLGLGELGTLAGPKGAGKIHFGADDNGSGTCGLLELARRFGAMKNRVGRRIVFIAFSGEERGLLGSLHYCRHPLFPLDKTTFMLNMDMIGRVVGVEDDSLLSRRGAVLGAAAAARTPDALAMKDRLVVYGTNTAEEMEAIVDAVQKEADFKTLKVPGGHGPSDHASFYQKRIPVLFFFTGLHKDYHRPSDTPDKINIAGILKVVDLAQVYIETMSTREKPLTYKETSSGWEDPTEEKKPRPRSTGPRLGIMPSYTEEVEGLLVEDVLGGGAAEKSGMKANDIITEIAGHPVTSITTYMEAMNRQKAGTEIEIVVKRKDQPVTLKVKLK